LLRAPIDYLPAFDKALKDVVTSLPNYVPDANGLETSFSVGLEGSFGDYFVSPRHLSSIFLGKLICIEGIVTRCKVYLEIYEEHLLLRFTVNL
jgi:DNA replication licensing factor MCM3